MRSLQVLVIDDEPAIRQVLASNLTRVGHSVEHLGDGHAAMERLAKGDVDVAICDIKMPGLTGIEVVRRSREQKLDTTFLMMTAFASMDTAIEAMRAGAYDYMIKPLRNEDVLHRVEQIANIISLRDENRALRSLVVGNRDRHCEMRSPAMAQINRLIAKVARTDSTVLVTGESGTGKGVIATSIHLNSPRADAPFIPVNCGAIPENLIESEFFGHAKGAFTGADRAKKGLFVEADRGTIFLDEVGELPLHLQVKLLHVIESKEVRAVGVEKGRTVDVRIIAATNRDLEKMVADGTFREDLYFRLNVFHVAIPALRERGDDLDLLIDFFLEKENARIPRKEPLTLDSEARQILLNHTWPSNVRELENALERAAVLADDEIITIGDLPAQLTKSASVDSVGGVGLGQLLRDQVKNFEIEVINRTVDECNGDRKLAAKKLGVGLSTLYRKLEEVE